MPSGPPLGFLGCNFEIGTSALFGDHQYVNPTSSLGNTWRVHDGFGIFATFNFPNKPYLTCDRDQAMRGTCHTFAAVSALEMAVARATARHLNLSEQDLNEHYKFVWNPDSRGWYVDSGSGAQVIQSAVANNYRVPYENDWPYNPSLQRVRLDSGIPGSPHGPTAGGSSWMAFPYNGLAAEVLRLNVALQRGVVIVVG